MRRLHALTFLTSLSSCVGDVPIMPDAGGGDAAASDAVSGQDAIAQDSGAEMGAPLSNVMVKLVDEHGNAIANADVMIGMATAKTDTTGSATLMAPPAYVLTVAYPAPNVSTRRLIEFRGLTTRTPIVEGRVDNTRRTSFTITTSGQNFPLPQGDSYRVLFSPTSASESLVFTPNQTPFPFSNAQWHGATPQSGTLYGFVVAQSAGFPVQWKSQSTPQNYTFADNGTFNPSINLLPGVASQSVGASLDRSGHNAVGLMMFVTPTAGGKGRMAFFNLNTMQNNLSATVPTASTVGISLGGVVNGVSVHAWKHNIAPGSTSNQLKLPMTLTALQSPADMTTNVDVNTMFSWSGPFPAFVLRVLCGTNLPSGPYTYAAEVLTTQTSGTMVDGSPFGAMLPSNVQCLWQVVSFAGAGAVDDLVKPTGWRRMTESFIATQDGAASATSRQFTSK